MKMRGLFIVLFALFVQIASFFLSIAFGGLVGPVSSVISFFASLIGGALCLKSVFTDNRLWGKGLNVLGVLLALSVAMFTLPLTGVAIMHWSGLDRLLFKPS